MSDRLPHRRTDVNVVEEDGQAHLETVNGDRICTLNESALAIWELCDGATTSDEMARAIAELCSIGDAQARKDVERTLNAFDVAGVIELRGATPMPGRPQ